MSISRTLVCGSTARHIRTITKEGTISTEDVTLELVEEWIKTADASGLPLGTDVKDAMARAAEARRKLDMTGLFELNDSPEPADLVHALCRILMEECVQSPRLVLRDAKVIHDHLAGQRWESDELSERERLLSSLALICWRACRSLNLGRESQEWWAYYTKSFRGSIDWDLVQAEWGDLDRRRRLDPAELALLGPETVVQMLLQLQDEIERNPDRTVARALAINRSLSSSRALAPDWQSFLQGESARLVGAALRITGKFQDATQWLDEAESHFLSSANPGPQLARIRYQRLAISYGLTELDNVLSTAPGLERDLHDLGMEEERVKCKILWAASLKVVGRPETALEMLEEVRRSMHGTDSPLLGWVLAEIGDIQGICGNYEQGLEILEEAAQILRQDGQATELAHVNSIIGCMCRSRGMLAEAIRLFRLSIDDFEHLGMASNATYVRFLAAETYLAMGRPRDAEREVVETFQFLEGEGIAADLTVALSIYREAIIRQKLEPQMLRELRERLRPENK